MLKNLIVFSLVVQTVLFISQSVLAFGDKDGQGQSSDSETDPYEFSATSTNSNSEFKKIDVTAVEVNDEANLDATLKSITAGKTIDATTVIRPDDHSKIDATFNREAAEVLKTTQSKIKQDVEMPTRLFPYWFKGRKARMTIILFEMVTMAGLKFTELTVGPEPVSHSAALTCGLMMAGLLGGIDYNINHVLDFLKNGTPFKWVLNRMAKSAEKASQSKTLNMAWQFVKTTGLNWAIFELFKMIILATTQDMQTVPEAVANSLHAWSATNMLEALTLAVPTTIISFPTTQVIMAFKERELNKIKPEYSAEQKKELGENLVTHVMSFMSGALSARAIMISSIMLAQEFDMPSLRYTAIAGLGVLVADSIKRLVHNAKHAKASCVTVLTK